MPSIAQTRTALIKRILEGEGEASRAQRRAEFDNTPLGVPVDTLIDKVATLPYLVSDEDIVAAKEGGLNEDQIFEMVVCAAIGEASRQYDRALMSLKAATKRD